MNANPLDRTKPPGVRSEREGDVAFPTLDIEVDERTRSVRVYDPRLFHAGRRLFCRRLIEAVSNQPGIRKAEIDLTSASCRVEFIPGSASPRSMSSVFVEAIRRAVTEQARDDGRFFRRSRARWSAVTAYRIDGATSLWETLENSPGRTRLRHRGSSRDRARLSRLADTVANVDGIESCRASSLFRQITIEYRPESAVMSWLVDTVERSWESLNADGLHRHERFLRIPSVDSNDPPQFATGIRRMMYLTLAAGSLVLTVAAIIVPGIPTVSCLLATSYFLARSSPRMNASLRRLQVFGPILIEWERFGGLSRASKGKLIGLTLVIVAATVAVAPLSAVTLVVIVLLSSLSVYEVVRMPAISEEPHASLRLNGSSRLALPAP